MIFQGAKKIPVNEIIVHCSATYPSWMEKARTSEKVAEIRRWHMQDRGWSDIGYHWIIDRDGTIQAGRAETTIGAHVQGHNAGTIGVSLIGGGGGAAEDGFEAHFTPAQERALRHKIEDIKARAEIRKVSGHNQYAAKACPCFYVPTWAKVHGLT